MQAWCFQHKLDNLVRLGFFDLPRVFMKKKTAVSQADNGDMIEESFMEVDPDEAPLKRIYTVAAGKEILLIGNNCFTVAISEKDQIELHAEQKYGNPTSFDVVFKNIKKTLIGHRRSLCFSRVQEMQPRDLPTQK